MMLVTLSLLSHGLIASGANIFGYIERSTITRLRTKSEVDASFMSFSCHFHIIFICLVPITGTRLVTLDVLVAMLGEG